MEDAVSTSDEQAQVKILIMYMHGDSLKVHVTCSIDVPARTRARGLGSVHIALQRYYAQTDVELGEQSLAKIG